LRRESGGVMVKGVIELNVFLREKSFGMIMINDLPAG
jgi:hypothetical protein